MKMISKVLRCRIGKKELCSLKSVMCLLSSPPTFYGKTSFRLILLFSLYTLAGFPSSQSTFSVSCRAVVLFLLEVFFFFCFFPPNIFIPCFPLPVLLQTNGVHSCFYFSLVSFVAVVFNQAPREMDGECVYVSVSHKCTQLWPVGNVGRVVVAVFCCIFRQESGKNMRLMVCSVNQP